MAEAKNLVDAMIDSDPFTLEFPGEEEAREFAIAAEELGATTLDGEPRRPAEE